MNGVDEKDIIAMVQDHERRITALESIYPDLSEIAAAVKKIGKYVKIWGPVVATAAISSGIVSGKWGAFFRALLQ